jgi:esterase/lipase superfamily enzyme
MADVYFGTNRGPSPVKKPTRFGKHFGEDGLSNLRFGKATVRGSKVSIRVNGEALKRLSGTNLTNPASSKFGSATMFEQLRACMQGDGCDTIVYIHGYNVSFKEAVKSAARVGKNFAHLNEGRGVNMVLFSWPSDGSMLPWVAYSSDRRDASASAPAFARGLLKLHDFMRELTTSAACHQSVHLIAHSMGNYVLRHALQEVQRQSPVGIPRMFDQIFLMAPDEDDDAFEHEHKLKLLPRLGRRVNVYFNRGDTAMAISDVTKGNPDRLGDDGPRAPFQVPAKVTQVDCSDVVRGVVEHSYFVDEPRVVQDMAQVLSGSDPMQIEGRRFLDDRNRFVIRRE